MAKRKASQGRGGWNSPVRSNDKAPISGCFQNLKQMLRSFILNVLLQKAYDLIRSIRGVSIFERKHICKKSEEAVGCESPTF